MTEAARIENEQVDNASLDRKLVCLNAWLERTTQKEGQAAQARSLLPATALTVGAALAAAFLSVGERWFGASGFFVMLVSALILFLYHQRQCAVWRRVACYLQKEQKILSATETPKAWRKVARATPDELAHHYGQDEPITWNSLTSLGLYLTSFILAMLLMLFAITEHYDLLQPKITAAHKMEPRADNRPVF